MRGWRDGLALRGSIRLGSGVLRAGETFWVGVWGKTKIPQRFGRNLLARIE